VGQWARHVLVGLPADIFRRTSRLTVNSDFAQDGYRGVYVLATSEGLATLVSFLDTEEQADAGNQRLPSPDPAIGATPFGRSRGVFGWLRNASTATSGPTDVRGCQERRQDDRPMGRLRSLQSRTSERPSRADAP
jgi:hypothetical protein